MNDLILVKPTLEYAEEIMAYRREFLECGSSMDGCGALRRCDSAAAFVKESEAALHSETLRPGRVLATQLLCVRTSDRKVVGMIQIRHYFNDYLQKYGGHIGYSVRPSERRKGYAKAQLQLALPICRKLGLTKVLITCEPDNPGSEKTIVANGGVYESTVYCEPEDISLKRYWIDLQNHMNEKILGKCGFYCGACPTYIKGGCKGCDEAHQEGDCFTRDCVNAKGLAFCGECQQFPCQTILTKPHCTVLDKDWLLWKKNSSRND